MAEVKRASALVASMLVCEVCERSFRPTSSRKQRTCSKACALRNRPPAKPKVLKEKVTKPCVVCSAKFNGFDSAKYCSSECAYKAYLRRLAERYENDPVYRDKILSASHARRADKLGKGQKQILLTYLIERDRSRCQIPGCKFNSRKITKTGSRRPSIDHIVPLSKGGTHELSNVQLAHYSCNLSKHNRGAGDQLALIG